MTGMKNFNLNDRVILSTRGYYGYRGKVMAITYADPRLYDVLVDNSNNVLHYVEHCQLENEPSTI